MANRKLTTLLLAAAAILLAVPAEAGMVVGAGINPISPAGRLEAIPPMPHPGWVWIRGHWTWRGTWIWIPGQWTRPSGTGWVPGHWDQGPGGPVWVEGHWR